VGYFSGSHITSIYNAASRYSTYLAIAFAVLVVGFILRRVWRARREPRTDAT
jgi:membrane protein DedA with SNARE-associated domain